MQPAVKIFGRLGSLLILSCKFDSLLADRCFVTVPRWKQFCFFLIVIELRFVVLRPCRGSCPKCYSQELICSSSLHVLFVKQIQQQIFITLDQPLRINLPMLKLLISVSLNSLKQSRQRLLLPLPK